MQVRSPRPGEEDGKAYNFVTKTVMEAAIDNGDFIEFATFADNMYGTSKKAVKTVMDKGEIFQFQFYLLLGGIITQFSKESNLNRKVQPWQILIN